MEAYRLDRYSEGYNSQIILNIKIKIKITNKGNLSIFSLVK